MIPPAQPPQWNGPPPGQYAPGPVAPMVQSVSLTDRNSEWNASHFIFQLL